MPGVAFAAVVARPTVRAASGTAAPRHMTQARRAATTSRHVEPSAARRPRRRRCPYRPVKAPRLPRAAARARRRDRRASRSVRARARASSVRRAARSWTDRAYRRRSILGARALIAARRAWIRESLAGNRAALPAPSGGCRESTCPRPRRASVHHAAPKALVVIARPLTRATFRVSQLRCDRRLGQPESAMPPHPREAGHTRCSLSVARRKIVGCRVEMGNDSKVDR